MKLKDGKLRQNTNDNFVDDCFYDEEACTRICGEKVSSSACSVGKKFRCVLDVLRRIQFFFHGLKMPEHTSLHTYSKLYSSLFLH